MNLISLIGEQPLPNLLPVRHYGAASVCLVHTNDVKRSKTPAEHLKLVLETSECNVQLLEVDAYNITEIQKTLERYVQTQTKDCMFNITGGTKPMSIAAHAVASEQQMAYFYLKTEPYNSQIYHYSWKDKTLQLETQDLKASITLTEFLTLWFGAKGKGWRMKPHAIGNKGYPFEKSVSDTITPHFDEVMHSVLINNDQLEIDLLVRHGQQFLIMELKDSKNKNYNEAVRQLHTAGMMLGLFTQKIYVGTQFKKEWDLEPWEKTGIAFLELNGVVDGQLSEMDQQNLLAKMNAKLK
jgi:Family of unknown function (DUF6293)